MDLLEKRKELIQDVIDREMLYGANFMNELKKFLEEKYPINAQTQKGYRVVQKVA